MRNDPLSIRRKGYGPNTWRNIQIINTGLEENRKLYGKKDILTVFHTLACLWMHFVPVSIYLINQFPQITPIYLTTIVQNRYYTKKKKLKLLFILFFYDNFSNFIEAFPIPFTNFLHIYFHFVSNGSLPWKYKFPKIPLRSIFSLLYSYFTRSFLWPIHLLKKRRRRKRRRSRYRNPPINLHRSQKERIFHNPRAIIPFWNALPLLALIPRKQCNYDRRERRRRGSIPPRKTLRFGGVLRAWNNGGRTVSSVRGFDILYLSFLSFFLPLFIFFFFVFSRALLAAMPPRFPWSEVL